MTGPAEPGPVLDLPLFRDQNLSVYAMTVRVVTREIREALESLGRAAPKLAVLESWTKAVELPAAAGATWPWAGSPR